MGTILFIVAVLLTIVFYPLGFIYSFFRLVTSLRFSTAIRRFDEVRRVTAVELDKMGNTWMQEVFNDFLINKKGHKFGSKDETISYVLGKNKETNTLNWLGKKVATFLNFIEPSHVEKAINNSDYDNNSHLSNSILGK